MSKPTAQFGSLKFNPRILQKCPLCGELQPLLRKGYIKNPFNNNPANLEIMLTADTGYSFCNCHNIYFTDWKNIDQTVYDEEYTTITYGSENIYALYSNLVNLIYSKMPTLPPNTKILEIGVESLAFIDLSTAKYPDNPVLGLTLNKYLLSKNMKVYAGDIEHLTSEQYLMLKDDSYIFFSHILEHLQNPIATLKMLYDMLLPGGYLFIATPDTYFIDSSNPNFWQHWWIKEHHILFDMPSLIKILTSIGFESVYTAHNVAIGTLVCSGDMHLLMRKPV